MLVGEEYFMRNADFARVDTIPLEAIDVSQARLFESDEHLQYFARLRAEDPVHFCEKSDFGGPDDSY